MLKATQETKELLKRIGSSDPKVSSEAMEAFAQEIGPAVEEALFDGDNNSSIYESIDATEDGGVVKFPKDLVAVGTEDDYVAYTMPAAGAAVPERHVEGDEVRVPTYRVANSIDWDLTYARNSRIDVLSRAMEVLELGFVKKNNDDGWTPIITAAAQKGTIANDASASAGVFTKEALSVMIRQSQRAGGNLTSMFGFNITDIFISPEGMEDIRKWDLSTFNVDETTMREIFVQGGVANVFGVNINVYTEFGVGQEYQTTYSNVSGATAMGASDQEIFIGLDLDPRKKSVTFVRPISEGLAIFEDPTLHRKGRQGFYAWMELGHAVLDTRATYLGSF